MKKGDANPACAVCKYQRRRCTPNCPLAPYFPANHPNTFQNVHRLFGVSNVTKILDSLHSSDQKEDAMKSIIFEAEMRRRYPVHGCSVIIQQLRFQIECAHQELRRLYSLCLQVAACEEQLNNNNYNNHLNLDIGSGNGNGAAIDDKMMAMDDDSSAGIPHRRSEAFFAHSTASRKDGVGLGPQPLSPARIVHRPSSLPLTLCQPLEPLGLPLFLLNSEWRLSSLTMRGHVV
ncbi:LOB domain-containing protein 27 [Striga hermonthica]|uniref:LOB domain-containing protein 27 n=1 Tax=Striga hermonthica TaxID=68872 RepID=A0A9N7NFW1_STRHE|nr:LOB domain-containing protein 27 [Striga hermonthica]